MYKKYNAAIIVLVARTKILKTTLSYFYENWNKNYDYPIYLHTFGKIIPNSLMEELNKTISKNIFLKEIEYGIPDSINKSELFYNRKYNDYVKNRFPKKRIGYLHMLRFATNIVSFGQKGCLVKEMENFDYLLKFDDESWFKKKIDLNLFESMENYEMGTAYADGDGISIKIQRETRENLWDFYKSYINKYKYIPRNEILKKALKNDDAEAIHTLKYKCGNCEFYNIKKILQYPIIEYLKYANAYGGDYKYRWGDNEVLGLFAYTHFKEPFLNFNLKENEFYLPSYPSDYTDGYAPSPENYFNIHNNLLFYLLLKIKKIFFK